MDFRHLRFDHFVFNQSLIDIDFTGSHFENCKFLGFCEMNRVNFSESTINADFKGATLYDCNFADATLFNTHFSRCFMVDPDYTAANLRHVIFDACSIKGADFLRASMGDVYFGDTLAEKSKNTDTLNITMGGATDDECLRHKQAILSAIRPEKHSEKQPPNRDYNR